MVNANHLANIFKLFNKDAPEEDEEIKEIPAAPLKTFTIAEVKDTTMNHEKIY